jgi:hypothetical protein
VYAKASNYSSMIVSSQSSFSPDENNRPPRDEVSARFVSGYPESLDLDHPLLNLSEEGLEYIRRDSGDFGRIPSAADLANRFREAFASVPAAPDLSTPLVQIRRLREADRSAPRVVWAYLERFNEVLALLPEKTVAGSFAASLYLEIAHEIKVNSDLQEHGAGFLFARLFSLIDLHRTLPSAERADRPASLWRSLVEDSIALCGERLKERLADGATDTSSSISDLETLLYKLQSQLRDHQYGPSISRSLGILVDQKLLQRVNENIASLKSLYAEQLGRLDPVLPPANASDLFSGHIELESTIRECLRPLTENPAWSNPFDELEVLVKGRELVTVGGMLPLGREEHDPMMRVLSSLRRAGIAQFIVQDSSIISALCVQMNIAPLSSSREEIVAGVNSFLSSGGSTATLRAQLGISDRIQIGEDLQRCLDWVRDVRSLGDHFYVRIAVNAVPQDKGPVLLSEFFTDNLPTAILEPHFIAPRSFQYHLTDTKGLTAPTFAIATLWCAKPLGEYSDFSGRPLLSFAFHTALHQLFQETSWGDDGCVATLGSEMMLAVERIDRAVSESVEEKGRLIVLKAMAFPALVRSGLQSVREEFMDGMTIYLRDTDGDDDGGGSRVWAPTSALTM